MQDNDKLFWVEKRMDIITWWKESVLDDGNIQEEMMVYASSFIRSVSPQSLSFRLLMMELKPEGEKPGMWEDICDTSTRYT